MEFWIFWKWILTKKFKWMFCMYVLWCTPVALCVKVQFPCAPEAGPPSEAHAGRERGHVHSCHWVDREETAVWVSGQYSHPLINIKCQYSALSLDYAVNIHNAAAWRCCFNCIDYAVIFSKFCAHRLAIFSNVAIKACFLYHWIKLLYYRIKTKQSCLVRIKFEDWKLQFFALLCFNFGSMLEFNDVNRHVSALTLLLLYLQ